MNDLDPLNNLFPKPREEIINMQSYSAPLENRRNLLRLDFNENTLGPSPKVLEFESSTSIKNTLLVKNKAKVLLKSDEFEGERLGYVSRINKTINANSQNMSVFIESTDNDLYNGMYVFGEIIVGEAENTFLVKRNLIDKNKMYVIVDNKLVSKKIEIVQVSEENAVIKGLKNNDLILNERSIIY